MGLTILVGFFLGACSSSPSPQASTTTTTSSAPPTPALVSANQSPEGDAQLACNEYPNFLSLFPTYRHNPGQADRAVEAWFSEAAAADRGNTAYHHLATDISTFLTEVGDPAKWERSGRPTDPRFTAIQTECGALLAQGLVH